MNLEVKDDDSNDVEYVVASEFFELVVDVLLSKDDGADEYDE